MYILQTLINKSWPICIQCYISITLKIRFLADLPPPPFVKGEPGFQAGRCWGGFLLKFQWWEQKGLPHFWIQCFVVFRWGNLSRLVIFLVNCKNNLSSLIWGGCTEQILQLLCHDWQSCDPHFLYLLASYKQHSILRFPSYFYYRQYAKMWA